jgi:NagD protein
MALDLVEKLKIDETKNYLIAIEGVLIRGDQMIPGADLFLQQLRKRKVKFLLLTNNSRYTPSDLTFRLQKLGLTVQVEEVFTSALATAHYLHIQKSNGSAYIIGESGLLSALREINFVITDKNPEYVVLGGTDRYNIEEITKAINLILNGAHFICTNPEPSGMSQDGLFPATGAMAALLQKATGIEPFFIGKPSPLMMRLALSYLGTHSRDAIVIGDRMDTDILAGIQNGIETILVLTGSTRLEDLARVAYEPTYIIRSIADFDLGVSANRL